MIDAKTIKYKDRTYFLEFERDMPDYTVGYTGHYDLISITTEEGRELKGLINGNIEQAIFEQIYL